MSTHLSLALLMLIACSGDETADTSSVDDTSATDSDSDTDTDSDMGAPPEPLTGRWLAPNPTYTQNTCVMPDYLPPFTLENDGSGLKIEIEAAMAYDAGEIELPATTLTCAPLAGGQLCQGTYGLSPLSVFLSFSSSTEGTYTVSMSDGTCSSEGSGTLSHYTPPTLGCGDATVPATSAPNGDLTIGLVPQTHREGSTSIFDPIGIAGATLTGPSGAAVSETGGSSTGSFSMAVASGEHTTIVSTLDGTDAADFHGAAHSGYHFAANNALLRHYRRAELRQFMLSGGIPELDPAYGAIEVQGYWVGDPPTARPEVEVALDVPFESSFYLRGVRLGTSAVSSTLGSPGPAHAGILLKGNVCPGLVTVTAKLADGTVCYAAEGIRSEETNIAGSGVPASAEVAVYPDTVSRVSFACQAPTNR